MKKLFFFLSVLICISSLGQSELERLIKLESRFLQIDKDNYEKTKSDLLIVAENYPVLMQKYKILEATTDFSILLSELTHAANPSNDSLLGDSYNNFIIKNAKDILLTDLESNASKGFSFILDKINNIPIIGDVINSNPVASMVTQVVSSASNFLNHKVVKKTIQYGEGINQQKLEADESTRDVSEQI